MPSTKNTMLKQVKPCPKCENIVGWYEKRVHAYDQYFHPDGEPSHAADGDSRGGKQKFCYNCNRNITKCISDS